jgi:uncharacterized protein YodC (DUF2158 family)
MNIDSARLVLKNLGNNGELLAQINKQIQNKEIEISEYSNKRPTIEKLEARISELIQNRDNSNGDFALVEKNYGRLLVKLDKCKYIKRTAKKSEAFRESLPSFVQEGNCEYRNATHIASTYKNQAKKDGVFEAYDLMCGSDIMVRTIDVGQTCEEQGPRTQVIETYFSSNFEGESSYRNNLRAGNERVKVLKYPDAKRIRITIKHIDIEYSGNFDHLTITDSYGNEVAKLFNKSQGVPLGSYESPWFDGNSLQLTFHSDGFTTRSGFELYEFEVEL